MVCTWRQFVVKTAVADRGWFEQRLEICGHVQCKCESVCDYACVLYVTTCVFLPVCLRGAFIRVSPVTSSLVWTVNTGKFEVRLTRACVGCRLLSLLSQIKELGGHRSRWGEKGDLSRSLSLCPGRAGEERGKKDGVLLHRSCGCLLQLAGSFAC